MAIQLRDPLEGRLDASLNKVMQLLQQRRQLEQMDVQLTQEQQKIDLAKQSQEAAREFEAFNKFKIVADSMLAPGQPIAEIPALVMLARKAFPTLADEDLVNMSALPWDSELIQDTVNKAAQQAFNRLPLDSPLRQRTIGVVLTGQPVSSAQIAAGEAEAGAQTSRWDTFKAGLDVLGDDPEFIKDMVRTGLGMNEVVNIPGVTDEAGNPIAFDSEQIASIWAQMRMNSSNLSMRLMELEDESRLDLEKRITDLGASMKIAIGDAGAKRILAAYEASATGKMLPGGKDPWEELMTKAPAEMVKVARAFESAVDFGQDAFMSGQPQELQDFFGLTGALADRFGTDDQMTEILEMLVEGGIVQIPGLEHRDRPSMMGGGFRFRSSGREAPAAEEAAPTTLDFDPEAARRGLEAVFPDGVPAEALRALERQTQGRAAPAPATSPPAAAPQAPTSSVGPGRSFGGPPARTGPPVSTGTSTPPSSGGPSTQDLLSVPKGLENVRQYMFKNNVPLNQLPGVIQAAIREYKQEEARLERATPMAQSRSQSERTFSSTVKIRVEQRQGVLKRQIDDWLKRQEKTP